MNQFIRLIDRLFRPVQRHVGTRFILVSSLLLLGALSVGVTTYQSLIKMQNKIDKEMTEQVATLTNNAEISREALELFIHINVFENTIGFDSTQLTKEGLSIGERLQKIKSFSNNQAMLGVLDNFIDDIHRLIGNALAMNNIQVEELQEIMKLKELVNSAYQPLYQSKILKILNDIVLQSSELIAQLRSQIPPKDAMILLAEINLSFEHFSEKLNKENILIDYAELSSQLKVRIDKSKEVTKKLKVNLLQRQKIKDDLARSRQALLFLIKKQERTAGDNVSNLKNDFNSAVLKVNTSTSIITLIVILLGGLLILYMVRQHINKPMEDLIKGINKVESKNFNGPAICLNRKDEWDSLERAFNNMAMGLSESYEQLNNERQRFDFLAHHDPLTGLVNRLFINKELESIAEKAKQSHQSFAVIYMDLDQFKRINDSLGHIIGDGLLKQVAKRILKTLNGEGHAARLGGDEFLLVLPHMPNKQKAKEFASQLNKVIAEPYSLDSQNIFITNSIGICFYPNDAEDVTKLVRNADTALYQAKRAGRDCYKFYNKEMTSHAYQLLDQNSGIRRALENDEFRLLFQPKVNLLSSEMEGAEVLIRWQHPDIGLLTPNKFLPAAEEIGLIT
ncbi:MAG: bifunctional diguanylate cyclase/phosphodiesterase, partial [Kangiellaceae bacterium]